MEKNSPWGISSSRLETAVTSPKVLFSFFKLTAEVLWAELLVKISPSHLKDFFVSQASPRGAPEHPIAYPP
jgi:hypothetical protein